MLQMKARSFFIAVAALLCVVMTKLSTARACTPASNPNSIYGNYICQSNSSLDAPVMWQPDLYLVFWGWGGCGPGIEDADK